MTTARVVNHWDLWIPFFFSGAIAVVVVVVVVAMAVVHPQIDAHRLEATLGRNEFEPHPSTGQGEWEPRPTIPTRIHVLRGWQWHRVGRNGSSNSRDIRWGSGEEEWGRSLRGGNAIRLATLFRRWRYWSSNVEVFDAVIPFVFETLWDDERVAVAAM